MISTTATTSFSEKNEFSREENIVNGKQLLDEYDRRREYTLEERRWYRRL